MSELNFAKAALPFQRAAFPQGDLLPIIPPGAKLIAKSDVDPKSAGKIPGRYYPRSQEWSGLTGAWPTMGVSPSFSAQASAWPTSNVGLRAENWPGLDIDVASAEARELVEALASFHLGYGPVRIRNGAPRALIVFQKAGDEPIRKMRLVFKDKSDTEHAVELLAHGQQYLIAGMHPSGAPYEWREGADLATWGATSLTKITADDARNFFDALHADIVARGWTVVRDIRLRPSAQGVGFAVKDLEPVVSKEVALAALRSIPNTEDVLPMREDLVALLAAFKAAVGKHADECETAVREWAAAFDWADEAYVSGVWRSLTHVRVGPDHLFGTAHKFGFVGDAQEDFKDATETETPIAAAQAMQDEEDAKLASVAAKLVYWPDQMMFIIKETGQQLSHSALNSFHGLGTEIAPSGASGVRSAANKLINSGKVTQVAGVTYLPGKPQLATWTHNGKGALYFNRWVDAELSLPKETTDDRVRPWLSHIEYLFENEEDREYLLDFLAHLIQHRGRKIRWAPIIIGNQGVGKDLFLRPVLKGLAHNARTVQPQDLMGRFIDFYEKELVIVEEMMRFEKNEVYERMKATISGTASDTNTVERKFQMPYEVPNVVNFIFFSNHSDALNLSHDDRRFFVINSHATARENEYYTNLADAFYEDQEGWKHVVTWLRQRDISRFNPNHRPKMNEDKESMIRESQPVTTLWLMEELTTGAYKHRSILTVSEILMRCASDFSIPDHIRKGLKYSSQVANALRYARWHQRSRQIRINGQGERPYCKTPEIAALDNELFRARYKAETEKKLANVG